MFIVPSKNYVSKPRWLAQSKRTPPLAGKLQSPLCAGWRYVSFRIFYYASWLTTVLHDAWLGVLFLKLMLAGSEERVIFSQES